jgi:hypothetical protein
MENFSEQEGILRIGSLSKIGCCKSTAENFLVYIGSISLKNGLILNLVCRSSPCPTSYFAWARNILKKEEGPGYSQAVIAFLCSPREGMQTPRSLTRGWPSE